MADFNCHVRIFVTTDDNGNIIRSNDKTGHFELQIDGLNGASLNFDGHTFNKPVFSYGGAGVTMYNGSLVPYNNCRYYSFDFTAPSDKVYDFIMNKMRDTYLDTNPMERERGITIFSKQARMTVGDTEFVLLDTPGHTDFSAEAERTLSVLDYAILVISGSEGVQNHTLTLWQLLRTYRVPTFLFINKTDLPTHGEQALAAELAAKLDPGCTPLFTGETPDARDERLAMADEALMEL